MKKTAYGILFITVLSFGTSLSAKSYTWAYVTVSKLFFRNKPGLRGKKKGSLALGEKVLILERSARKEKIGDKRAYWVRIESGAKKGWVFAAFLSSSPILTPTQMARKMKGLYYYSQKSRPNVINRILKINGRTYTEKIFSLSLGISDKYTGKVVYQADSLYLMPLRRWVRPAAYIVYPRGRREQSVYSRAYRFFSNEESHLVRLKRFGPGGAARTKYYIHECRGKVFMTSAKDKSCDSLTWAYEKK